jgi:alkylation response protein AidB-like acyl-CoA dehydrogenase
MTMTLVCETMGRQAFSLASSTRWASSPSAISSSLARRRSKRTVLTGFVQGDPPVALGITEPQAGSDAAALKTTADL